jgi:hypothetical protein
MCLSWPEIAIILLTAKRVSDTSNYPENVGMLEQISYYIASANKQSWPIAITTMLFTFSVTKDQIEISALKLH